MQITNSKLALATLDPQLPTELAQLLGPPIAYLRLEQVRLVQSETEARLVVRLVSTAPTAYCPACNEPSRRVHKYYQHKVADLSWGAYGVALTVRVRYFYCGQTDCPQATFAERLGPQLPAYARRTTRLATWLTELALTAGGEAGGKLAHHAGLIVSPSTLLRLIKRLPLPTYPPPRVVGLDDFALRKGHTYGTLVMDLEKRVLLALLADRQTSTVREWLSQQQTAAQAQGRSIEVISRDRYSGYAKAAAEAVPTATQVADRFHLKQNLHQSVQKIVRRLYPTLKPTLQRLYAQAQVPSTKASVSGVKAEQPIVREGFSRLVAGRATPKEAANRPEEALKLSYWDRQKEVTQQKRVALYEQVQALVAQGVKSGQIARQLAIDPKTAKRLAAQSQPPTPIVCKKRAHPLDPYKAYVEKRFGEGYDNARGLGRELSEQGYTGSQVAINRYVKGLRALRGGIELGGHKPTTMPFTPLEEMKLPSVYELSWWVMLDGAKLGQSFNYLKGLCAENSELARTYELSQQFNTLLSQRQPTALSEWLEEMEASGIAELVSLGRGMRQDEAAIRAGLTVEWSQGMVEGKINKLKVIKRQMYGRGSLDLLRRRLLAA